MRITLNAIKEFWKLPEGKQFLSGCFLAIGVLCTVIGVLCNIIRIDHVRTIPALTNDKLLLTKQNGDIQHRCDTEKAQMSRDFERWKFDFISVRYEALDKKEWRADSANEATIRIMQLNQKALNKSP